MLPSTITAAMKTSVMLNGVARPFRRAVDGLIPYCRPFVLHNDDPNYEVSPVGSAFQFRYGGANYIICTRHQLGDGPAVRDPRQAVLLVGERQGPNALGPDEVITLAAATGSGEPVAEDLLLLRFDDVRNERSVVSHFARMDQAGSPPLEEAEDVVAIFAIGYPSRHAEYTFDYDDDFNAVSLEVTSRWSRMYLERTDPNGWDHDDRLPLTAHQRYAGDVGDPDGFSGAPVFFVHRDASLQAHLGFAGIVTHANAAGRFNVYSWRRIRPALQRLRAGR